jgi:hypothetical protein
MTSLAPSLVKSQGPNAQEESESKSREKPVLMPVWHPRKYSRVAPGIYEATATRIIGPDYLAQHHRYSVGIEFELCSFPATRLVLFLNLGDGSPRRGGDYFKYWSLANGAAPRDGEPMDPVAFVAPGRTYEIEVVDNGLDPDGKPKPDAEVYSKVAGIVSIFSSDLIQIDNLQSTIRDHQSLITNQESTPIVQSSGAPLEKDKNQAGPLSSDTSPDQYDAPMSSSYNEKAELLIFPDLKSPSAPRVPCEKRASLSGRSTAQKVRSAAKIEAVKRIFSFYCSETDRNQNLYTLTRLRMQKGLARLQEALEIANGDLPDAEVLLQAAVRELALSDWHMGRNSQTDGKRYVEWEDHLFSNAEQFQKWLGNAEEGYRRGKGKNV